MPYIGRAATNAGSVNYLDDISSGFDGSDTTFTCAIKGTTITPGQENVYIYLDGVFQHPSDAYSISGSTITFTEAPVNGTDFTAYVAGEGAYLDDGTVSTAKLDDDAVTASKLDDDGTGFQVGDLGVGGSLTSGDKLTVTGRLRASGGIIGNLTGNVTGNTSGTALTVTQAAQTAITSLGTLTGLATSGNVGIGSATTSSPSSASRTLRIQHDTGSASLVLCGDNNNESAWDILANADGALDIRKNNHSQLKMQGGVGMRVESGGSGATIGNPGAQLHVAHSSSTAYNGAAEILESTIIQNTNGSDGSGVNNVASLGLQVGSGATSQGFLNYKRTGDNAGYFTFSQRHSSSGYAETMWINSATNNWCVNVASRSPYGMQIATTATGSSHDMFVVKNNAGTRVLEAYGNEVVKIGGQAIVKDGLKFLAASGNAPTGTDHNDVPIKFASYTEAVDSTDVSNGSVDLDLDIYRDNYLSLNALLFDSNTNVVHAGLPSDESWLKEITVYASGGVRVHFGNSVASGDTVKLLVAYTGNTG